MMTIGEQIRSARKKVGMTQAGLAEKLGISYVGISQWENGLRKPKYETKRRIAHALNLPYYEVFTDVDDDLVRAAIEDSALGQADFIIAEDADFIKQIQPYLSDLEPLSDEEAALKTLLNSMGYNIMKTRGTYFFTYENGGSEISTDDLNELLNCAQNGLKIAAKSLELKLMQEAFGPRYPTEIVFPTSPSSPDAPPPAPEGNDTTPTAPSPESPEEGE